MRIEFNPHDEDELDESNGESEVKAKLKTELMGARGFKLPFGTMDPTTGERSQRLAFREWDFALEKKISKRRDKMQAADLPTFVSAVLAETIEVIGAHDFISMDRSRGKSNAFEARQAAISGLLMGDVFFAYLALRVHALGKVFKMRFRCAQCGERYTLPIDLESAEVKCADTLEAMLWTYALERPLEIQDKRIVELDFGPMRWSSLMGVNVQASGVVAASKMAFIRDSIAKVRDEGGREYEIKPSEVDLAPMTKRDIEAIANELDEHQPGPDMSVEHDCAKCDHENRFSIDWGYDGFFGTSSR